jgi:hypothetical protein
VEKDTHHLEYHKVDQAKNDKVVEELKNDYLVCREVIGTHETHYAMLENFIEKYVPSLVQT